MMITSLDVANTFLVRARKEKIDISPMKLQKLLYILYKTYLKKTRKRLFSQKFEAWKYGPVLPEVYREFKKYHSNRIDKLYVGSDGSYRTVKFSNNRIFDKTFNEVWEKYHKIDGIYLSQLTHQENTAWSKANDKHDLYLSDKDIFDEEEYTVIEC